MFSITSYKLGCQYIYQSKTLLLFMCDNRIVAINWDSGSEPLPFIAPPNLVNTKILELHNNYSHPEMNWEQNLALAIFLWTGHIAPHYFAASVLKTFSFCL